MGADGYKRSLCLHWILEIHEMRICYEILHTMTTTTKTTSNTNRTVIRTTWTTRTNCRMNKVGQCPAQG